MYKGKKILSLITARGGSKGVPKKNIRILGDKPLIAWTIESSLASKYIDRTILSSDSDEIINISKKYGCEAPFKRPVELAQDETTSIDVIIHALGSIKKDYDYLVLLQPTSPFRHDGLIDKMISEIIDNNYEQLVSVKKLKKESNYLYYKSKDSKLLPISGVYVKNKRRQDQSSIKNNIFEHNGSVYISKIDFLLEKKSYNCEETRMFEMFGKENIDIDEEIDFSISELYLQNTMKYK